MGKTMTGELAFVVATALIASGALGCGKRAECNRLIESINDDDEVINGIDTKVEDPKKLSASMREISAVETKLSSDLGNASFKVPEVKKFAIEYQAFASDVSKDAAGTADILDQLVVLQQKADDKDPKSLLKQWSTSVSTVVDRCNAHPAHGCSDVAHIFKHLPDPKDPEAFAVGLDKAAGDMRKINSTDATLRTDLTDLTAKTADVAKLFHDMADLEKRADANETKMKTIGPREDALTDQINTFCGAKK